MAVLIHRHFTTIQKWEDGSNAVGLGELELLAEVYGVDARALMFDPDNQAMFSNLKRAHSILQRMDEQTAEIFLQFGERLPGRPL